VTRNIPDEEVLANCNIFSLAHKSWFTVIYEEDLEIIQPMIMKFSLCNYCKNFNVYTCAFVLHVQ
jgi:hypothetical protein